MVPSTNPITLNQRRRYPLIQSYGRILSHIDEYDRLMPSHNEPRMEKHLIRECHDAVVSIRDGATGTCKEGTANGVKVHRYDYERFSLIVRAERS